jgi:hypothetical protein
MHTVAIISTHPDCVIEAVQGTDNLKMPHRLVKAVAANSPNGDS